MPKTETVHVPHLFGTEASYQIPRKFDESKTTCVFINSFTMTSDLYAAQFKDQKLLDAMNMIAVEPYGHGQTRAGTDTFTFWDSAIMTLQVLDALKVEGKVFALGTSQGGWIVVRMALLQPDRIAGIIPLGTSMDFESERTRELGNFDMPGTLVKPTQELQSLEPTPDFVTPNFWRELSIYYGLGKDVDKDTVDFWWSHYDENYKGDDGRKRLRQSAINLYTRDGLHERLTDVRCPVLWLHGTMDAAYSIANAEEEIKMFANSPDARLQVVEGGQHYLSASHPDVVDNALLEFVKKHS